MAKLVSRIAFFKNMMYLRKSHTLAIHLNINERFVSRGGIYDNSTGRLRERNAIIAAIYCPHILPTMHRYISDVHHDCALF